MEHSDNGSAATQTTAVKDFSNAVTNCCKQLHDNPCRHLGCGTPDWWVLIHGVPCIDHRHCLLEKPEQIQKKKEEIKPQKPKFVGIDSWLAYSNSPNAKELESDQAWSGSQRLDTENLIYKEFEKDFTIYFRINKSDIEPGFMDNAAELKRMRSTIDSLLRVNPEAISRMKIRGTASPDGPYSSNLDLAKNRALSLKRYITDRFPQYDSDKIEIFSLAEDWISMREIVEADPNFPDREKLLELIDDDTTPLDRKEKQLREMRTAFRYLINNHVYKLRTSMVKLTISIPAIYVKPLHAIEDRLGRPDTLYREIPVTEKPVEEYQTIVAFKSNLLVPALNVGMDIPIGNHLSIGFNYYYPWWLHKKNMYCAQMVGLFADMKYWFGDEIGDYGWTGGSKLKGHAIGIYGGVGYYDYQWQRSGYQGEYFDIGMDYTWSMPIGSRDQFRLEFNIGFGWIRTWRRHYTPTDDWSILIKDPGIKHEISDFFGPTRLSVSFVWPIVVKTNVRK